MSTPSSTDNRSATCTVTAAAISCRGVISYVDSMQGSMVAGVIGTLGELVSFIGALTSVLYINWKVGMLTIVPLTVVYFMVRAFNVKVKALYGQAREQLGRVSARLQDNLGGFHLIKSFHTEANEESRFGEATAAHYDKTMEAVKIRTRISRRCSSSDSPPT